MYEKKTQKKFVIGCPCINDGEIWYFIKEIKIIVDIKFIIYISRSARFGRVAFCA